MAEVVNLHQADDPRDVIHRAVHRLVEGELVAFPTETTYVVAANSLLPEAVSQLRQFARSQSARGGDTSPEPLLLGLKCLDQARDYVASLSKSAERLMHRGWPGPLVLAVPVSPDQGLLKELPPETRTAILRPSAPSGREVWLRVPAHDAILSAMSLLPGPLVLWEDRPVGDRELSSPRNPSDWASWEVALIVQDQPRQYLKRPTVVRIEDQSWTLLEAGVVTESQLDQMTGKVILFVCTGNTCRSPMAEGIFRGLLASRLGCEPAELPERGYVVMSAGLAAVLGAPASPESVDVAGDLGADLNAHRSQPLTDDLLAQADRVFTMTQGHLESITYARPDATDRVSLLATDGSEIPDPMGGSVQDYEFCGREIARHLKAILDEFEPPDGRRPL